MPDDRVNNTKKWLEYGFLLAALAAFTITEVYRPYVSVGLVFLGTSFILRGLRTGRLFPKNGLEVPLILFISSAAIATWIAFDRPTAALQFARILAGCALFYAVIDSSQNVRRLTAALLVLASVVLAIYWPIQHDFTAQPAKFDPLNTAGLWVNTHLPHINLSTLTGSSIHANVAAGTLLLAIPFGVYLSWVWLREKRPVPAIISIAATLIITGGLLMTGSRGAWLGLVGASLIAGLVWIQRRWFFTPRDRSFFWITASLGAITFMVYLIPTDNLGALVNLIPGPTGSLVSRAVLWRQGASLIRDYPFTGGGLKTFWLVHPLYALLINVHVLQHVHNSFLEVWIEQGILGALALLAGTLVVATWAWDALSRKDVRACAWAGLFSLTAVALQGLFDVVFYIERTLPLIGLALGFAWYASSNSQAGESTPVINRRYVWIRGIILAVIVLSGFLFNQEILSSWNSNMGAINQTRAELAYYDPKNFADLSMDQIRRSIDLSQAEIGFNQALNYNNSNATAFNRLTQIEMSRREFSPALQHMQTAWDSGHRDDVTRLLYSDALVADGQTSPAADVVGGLVQGEGRLMYQAWYRYRQDKDYQRAVYAWQTVLLLNPDNQQAQQGLQDAQKRFDQQ
jgi:O-antigen ligase